MGQRLGALGNQRHHATQVEAELGDLGLRPDDAEQSVVAFGLPHGMDLTSMPRGGDMKGCRTGKPGAIAASRSGAVVAQAPAGG